MVWIFSPVKGMERYEKVWCRTCSYLFIPFHTFSQVRKSRPYLFILFLLASLFLTPFAFFPNQDVYKRDRSKRKRGSKCESGRRLQSCRSYVFMLERHSDSFTRSRATDIHPERIAVADAFEYASRVVNMYYI